MAATTFDSLHLPAPLDQAIADMGFTCLTDVQQAALPLTLAGKDIAAQGRTGTGKTAAFLITAIAHILNQPINKKREGCHPRVLIIAPTRELVMQISKDAHALCKHSNIHLHTVFGGVDYKKQQQGFAQDVDILMGTPGRLIDFFKQQRYSLKFSEMLIVDEADRMFDLGFIADIRFMMRRMPHWSKRQSLLFSATLSWRVMELAYEHMNNPEKIRAEEGNVTATAIKEVMYHTAMDEKKPLMVYLLRTMVVERGMVFVNEKRTGESLARFLSCYGFSVGILSGDVPQRKRMHILQKFTAGGLHILVATDVASRGLHIDGVTHVFNYDLPEDPESYVHRIGRTARAGASGMAVSLSCERFCFILPDIEAMITRRLPVEGIIDGALSIGKPSHSKAVPEGIQRHRTSHASRNKKKHTVK